ncbi:hypothetical protein CEXT_139541, partial [Caerostris extrusa]
MGGAVVRDKSAIHVRSRRQIDNISGVA